MSYSRILIAFVTIVAGLALSRAEASAATAACWGRTIEVYGNEVGDLVVGIDIAQGTCACANAWGPNKTYRSFSLPKGAANYNPSFATALSAFVADRPLTIVIDTTNPCRPLRVALQR